jgi:hypothetical protein
MGEPDVDDVHKHSFYEQNGASSTTALTSLSLLENHQLSCG